VGQRPAPRRRWRRQTDRTESGGATSSSDRCGEEGDGGQDVSDRAEDGGAALAGSKSKKVMTLGGLGERSMASGTKILHS
jgi:hypothetical protein